MQPVQNLKHAYSVDLNWRTQHVNTWKKDYYSSIRDIKYNALEWQNEYSFVAGEIKPELPLVSLIKIEDSVYIQVMLPII